MDKSITAIIIYKLRAKMEVTQGQLCSGLCSDKTMSRVEFGERIPDKFLLDGLLQRLGKSPDKIETILTKKDYYLFEKREEIEQALREGDFPLVKNLLKAYQELKEVKDAVGTLHQQYVLKIQVILDVEEHKDSHCILCSIQEALELTIIGFAINKIPFYRFTLEEVQLILMYAVQYAEIDKQEALDILCMLLSNLDNKYTDEEELVKIFPNVVCVTADQLIKMGYYEEAVSLCQAAIHLLVNNGAISCMLELLQLSIKAMEHLEEKEEQSIVLQKQLHSLAELYREYQIQSTAGSHLIAKITQNELYLVHELIKNHREIKGITQHTLSNSICSAETLSRIESGRTEPSTKNFTALLDKLEIQREFHNSVLLAEEFEAYECKREIAQKITLNLYDVAENLFNKLKAELDTTKPKNLQFIMSYQILFDTSRKEITTEEAIPAYEEALRCTQKEYGTIPLERLMLAKEETVILNRIAVAYAELGDKTKAIEILRSILKSFEATKVDPMYHSLSILLTMINLADNLEEEGYPEESREICDKAVRLSIRCGRGNLLPNFITTKVCCLEKMRTLENSAENKNTCTKYLQQAFYLSNLLTNEQMKNIIKDYYHINYQEYEKLI